jgi:hypothetical protein
MMVDPAVVAGAALVALVGLALAVIRALVHGNRR